MTREVSNMDDVIDVRDVIERVEELQELATTNTIDEVEVIELRQLTSLLEDLKGYGGDHQWNGDWYPVTLIRDSYFEDYAQELAEDCGMINSNATWPNNCIDWKQAAKELQVDYSTVEYDGVTYWYR